MSGLAADTWGISGPDFLALYVPVAVVAVLAGAWLRRGVLRRDVAKPRLAQPGTELTAPELGMLVDNRRPVLAALALLRAEQLIGSDGTPVPGTHGVARLDRFSEAVFERIRAGASVKLDALALASAPDLARLRVELVRRGYLPGPELRRELRDAGMPVLIVATLGVVRLVAGLLNGNGVGLLAVVLLALGLSWFPVTRAPRLTALGQAAQDYAITANGYLRPHNAPAYETYGARSAALGAALFGTAALLTFDAGLANAAEPPSGGGDAGGGDGGGGGGGCGGCGGCGG